MSGIPSLELFVAVLGTDISYMVPHIFPLTCHSGSISKLSRFIFLIQDVTRSSEDRWISIVGASIASALRRVYTRPECNI